MRRHFTATAFVMDSRGRTLLLWHLRLKRWMPPGGHVDADETPDDAARRECREETGLEVELMGDPQQNVFAECPQEGSVLLKPVALLLENIPESPERNEPAHQHMDFVYLARPKDENAPLKLAESEGRELKWFTRQEIAALRDFEIFGNVRAFLLSALSAPAEG